MWLAVLLVLGRVCLLDSQKPELPASPCPSVFSYEGRSPEPDRWYGVVLVTTDSPLTGMRLDIKLSHPAQLLGNWEGEVTTSDNKRFIILNLDKKIVPGPPISVRIFVRYAEDKAVPVVDMIALNGRQICPPLQAGISYRPPVQTSETNNVWHPPGLETSLEPAEPLEIDSTYQVSIPRPEYNSYDDRTTKRPGSNKRPSDGYDDRTRRPPNNDFQTTRRPSGGGYDSDFQNPSGNRPSSGSYGNTEYENPSPPRQPVDSYDSEFQNPSPPRQPSYDSDSQNRQTTRRPGGNYDNSGYETPSRPSNNNGYQNSATTERPSNNYDNTNYENPSPPRRPNDNFGNNGYDSPTTKRPSNNYDNTYENESPPRRPTDNYGNNEFESSQTTRRPSNNNDYRTTTTRRPGSENTDYHGTSSNNNNGYQSSGTTRKPSSNSQTTRRPTEYTTSTTRRPNYPEDNRRPSEYTTSTTRRPGYPEDNRRPGQDDTTRRPTTLSIASGSGGNRRPPDKDVNSPSRGSQPQRTTRRPDRESSDNDRVECGKLHISATPLVTNGQNTARGQWPWHAALYKAKGINLTYICGGTLVSPTAVVTAAHCVTKMIGNWPVDPDSLVIYLGKYHLKLWSEGGVQNKQVAEVHVHPQYNSSDFRSDVAVLVLSSPADFTEFVRPVCLWGNGNTDLRDIEGQVGYVVGWGYDEESRVTEQLMMARMPIVSQQACLWSYPEFFSHFTNNRTYCAGFNNGTSVCNGDSGGGMVLPEEQRDGSKIWRLRGLVSISVSKEEKRVCDTKHYVVFTDLAKYQDWIEQYIN